MILYHGSYIAIEKPDLSFSRNNTDFGKGFYTNTIKTQAEKWTERFKRNRGQGFISIYEIDEADLQNNISILKFDSYSNEWLDFIVKCRNGEPVKEYDLVIGGVANDDVFNTLNIYFRGFIDKTEAINRLRFEKLNNQYCFKKQEFINKYLKYTGMEKL